MNRPIEFRGKRKDNGEWVYGSLIYNNGEPYIVNNVLESTEDYIVLEEWQPVIPETVGQFTGEVDCYNNEVYSDDLLRDDDVIYKVVFEEGSYFLETQRVSLNFSDQDLKGYEVIGNIHEEEMK